MNKFIVLTGMFVLMAHSSLMGAPSVPQYQPPPQIQLPPQEYTYHQQLYQQLLIQEDRAAQYLTKMQVNPDMSGKFREAEKMLEVKQVLFKNFGQSPALANEIVRGYLLQLMSKEVIKPEELLKLQALVNKQLHRANN